MPMLKTAAIQYWLALALFCLGSAPAAVQAQASTAPEDAKPFTIQGFRSARFGMTRGETRRAAANDFPEATLEELTNPDEGTHVLRAKLARLAPGPGPAAVTYIFGATSERLSHINVIWTAEGEPNAEQRGAVAGTGVQLMRYFQSRAPDGALTSQVQATGPNELLMFSMVDAMGAGVEVVVTGVAIQSSSTGALLGTNMPVGQATARVSYFLNAANPDIRRVR